MASAAHPAISEKEAFNRLPTVDDDLFSMALAPS